jgi:hypothetical protein
MSRLHFTSVKMFGQTVKIQEVESIEMPDVGACCGIYESAKKRIRIARDEHEDGPEHDYLKTVTHELMHAFADLSGLTAYLSNDDTKEEKLVQDFENHFWPVLRAIARLEAGVPLDAQDKRAIRSRRVKATDLGFDQQAPRPDTKPGQADDEHGGQRASELPQSSHNGRKSRARPAGDE